MSPTKLPPILEKNWQAAVVETAISFGWTHVYHTYDSRRSTPGFPDLVLVRGPRLLFIECKGSKGYVGRAQLDWLAALRATKAEVFVSRPSNFDALKELLR